MKTRQVTGLAITLLTLLTLGAASAHAFCGFYVAKADATLWNEASQVAIVRDGERTVLTMSNDYKGALTEFALVVPVPAVLQKEQIHVGERTLIDRLDAFSAPRLVEYFDPDPCQQMYAEGDMGGVAGAPMARMAASEKSRDERARALGVTIEAQYTVGEYDILILGAKQSQGLETWLVENGYKLPKGASAALAPYIRQELKFFVARVNIKEQAKTGYSYLRPLQMAYESPRFMLPIRLGMINAQGPQDLVVYTLTRKGRVETQNYRTVKIPSGDEIPEFIKTDHKDFFRDLFRVAWEKEGKKAVMLEHFWDMSWCDPCAADPLRPEELRGLGVFWLDEPQAPVSPGAPAVRRRPQPAGGVLLTRLHLRYDAEHFPEDLVFQETADRQNFQGRYVIRHPFTGAIDCEEGRQYAKNYGERRQKEAETLAHLTGWSMDRIGKKMGPSPVKAPAPAAGSEWWRQLWK